MRKPLYKHEKDPAGLARSRRPLMTCPPLSQGHSLDARVMPGSVGCTELKHSRWGDISARERPIDGLRALISALFIYWMPRASVPA